MVESVYKVYPNIMRYWCPQCSKRHYVIFVMEERILGDICHYYKITNRDLKLIHSVNMQRIKVDPVTIWCCGWNLRGRAVPWCIGRGVVYTHKTRIKALQAVKELLW